MKVVVAPDSFKGTYSASEVSNMISDGLLDSWPGSALNVVKKPLADGGEGTLEAFKSSIPSAETHAASVSGPLKDYPVRAEYLFIPETKSVVVEMAQAAGLNLYDLSKEHALLTTTFGVGQIIKESLKLDPEHIYLAIGGSATSDLGLGAATALGWKFLKEDGCEISLGAEEIGQIKSIEKPDLNLPPMTVLCDVTNPLTGPKGSIRVYGPQKGVQEEDFDRLDSAFGHAAKIIQEQLGKDIENLPGAGAAGGLGGGSVAFFDAEIKPGIHTIAELTGFKEEVKDASWVISGEGSLDQQSFQGKVVSGVIEIKPATCKVAIIAGIVAVAEGVYNSHGVDVAYALNSTGDLGYDAMRDTPTRIGAVTKELVELWRQ